MGISTRTGISSRNFLGNDEIGRSFGGTFYRPNAEQQWGFGGVEGYSSMSVHHGI